MTEWSGENTKTTVAIWPRHRGKIMSFEQMVNEASRVVDVKAAIIMAGIAAVVGIAIVLIRHRRVR